MNFLYIYSIKCQTYSLLRELKKIIWHVLSKLSVSLLVLNQVLNSCKHKFAALLRFLPSLSNRNTLVSSVYNFAFAFDTDIQILLIYMKNNSGPNTEPCGTP